MAHHRGIKRPWQYTQGSTVALQITRARPREDEPPTKRPVFGPELPPNFGSSPAQSSSVSSRTSTVQPPAHRSSSVHQQRPSIGPQVPPSAQRAGMQAQQRASSAPHQQRNAQQATAAGAGKAAPTAGKAKKCDKCDGPHETDACPHFKKAREQHKDAWANYGQKRSKLGEVTGGRKVVRGAKVMQQPGDGSCLYHSLCFGLNGNQRSSGGAQQLRRELADFLERHRKAEISGDTIEEWIKWDTGRSVEDYVRRQRQSGWGGGIEMAACSLLKRVNVHVYEYRGSSTFERISCFEPPAKATRTINVLYKGRMHFDALIL